MSYCFVLSFREKNMKHYSYHLLCEKCPYSELFWSAFSCIRPGYTEILYLSVFSLNVEKCRQEQLRMRALFTQSLLPNFCCPFSFISYFSWCFMPMKFRRKSLCYFSQITVNFVIKPWPYIMTKAFFGGLIHGGAYILGGGGRGGEVIHGRKIALRLKVRVFS